MRAEPSKHSNVSAGPGGAGLDFVPACGGGGLGAARSRPPPRLATSAAARPSLSTLLPVLQIVKVDGEGLEAEILGRDRPLIIDFYATWCGPCVLLAQELETVRSSVAVTLPAPPPVPLLGRRGLVLLPLHSWPCCRWWVRRLSGAEDWPRLHICRWRRRWGMPCAS